MIFILKRKEKEKKRGKEIPFVLYFHREKNWNGKKLTSTVRESRAFRHNGNPFNPSIPECLILERFQEDPQLGSHDAERRQSLRQLYLRLVVAFFQSEGSTVGVGEGGFDVKKNCAKIVPVVWLLHPSIGAW